MTTPTGKICDKCGAEMAWAPHTNGPFTLSSRLGGMLIADPAIRGALRAAGARDQSLIAAVQCPNCRGAVVLCVPTETVTETTKAAKGTN